MRVRLHNRTGLTIHTSEHASSPSLAVSDVPVEMPAEAWEHTLSCGPGLRPLVGADGGIEVTEVGAKPVAVVAPVEAPAPVAVAEPEAPKPELVVKAPEPARQDKGKRR